MGKNTLPDHLLHLLFIVLVFVPQHHGQRVDQVLVGRQIFLRRALELFIVVFFLESPQLFVVLHDFVFQGEVSHLWVEPLNNLLVLLVAIQNLLKLILENLQRRKHFLVQLLQVLVQSEAFDFCLNFFELFARLTHVFLHGALYWIFEPIKLEIYLLKWYFKILAQFCHSFNLGFYNELLLFKRIFSRESLGAPLAKTLLVLLHFLNLHDLIFHVSAQLPHLLSQLAGRFPRRKAFALLD